MKVSGIVRLKNINATPHTIFLTKPQSENQEIKELEIDTLVNLVVYNLVTFIYGARRARAVIFLLQLEY